MPGSHVLRGRMGRKKRFLLYRESFVVSSRDDIGGLPQPRAYALHVKFQLVKSVQNTCPSETWLPSRIPGAAA